MNKSPRPSFRDVGWVRWHDFEGICSCGQISVGFSLMDWLIAFLSGRVGVSVCGRGGGLDGECGWRGRVRVNVFLRGG